MAKPEPTSAALYQYARGYASGRGYQFGSGAANDIRLSINEQVNARWQEFEVNEASMLQSAEVGIGRFIDAMIDARHSVYGAEELRSNVIGEATFAMARSRFCPLFPICR